jgi:hypothetical protein
VNPQNIPEGAVLLPPPTLAERHEINEFMRTVRSYSHPVIFNQKNSHVGTAVFLRHGERLFAFTAAHNVTNDMMIRSGLSSRPARTRLNVLSTFIHPRYDRNANVSDFDLAILELEPSPLVTAGDVGQLYTGAFERLPERDHKVMSNAFVWVVGFPRDLVERDRDRTRLYQTSFCTQILEHSTERLSLPYPEFVYRMPHDSTSCEPGETTPTPNGYSGAGVWSINYDQDGLFNPHRHIKLLGIQTHWTISSRLLRCVPSKVAAESLLEFKPELK